MRFTQFSRAHGLVGLEDERGILINRAGSLTVVASKVSFRAKGGVVPPLGLLWAAERRHLAPTTTGEIDQALREQPGRDPIKSLSNRENAVASFDKEPIQFNDALWLIRAFVNDYLGSDGGVVYTSPIDDPAVPDDVQGRSIASLFPYFLQYRGLISHPWAEYLLSWCDDLGTHGKDFAANIALFRDVTTKRDYRNLKGTAITIQPITPTSTSSAPSTSPIPPLRGSGVEVDPSTLEPRPVASSPSRSPRSSARSSTPTASSSTSLPTGVAGPVPSTLSALGRRTRARVVESEEKEEEEA
ncbi:hypothetical protein MVLG_06125 [Microbotryum lychnidis-dioicae p1A1 Lamole]|uniref:Uncharacterized protein n=1 Tax=Microbotryum lychnidis-dioicae (strain p1A1 Lamole / MvSl-1064) TaxID=683840 RepID=U5HGB4_USTV1|nr:hypothetical protein MVLG_06125 [Microbotryum lychnidis-dioicae p1A1 Lamole]|eukprot:KDE03409.1 hypothetical protein MVLG_06125 [Microbotryum lychnidis-dioicae p1A1 Lamole]